jgi:hypothetical protein
MPDPKRTLKNANEMLAAIDEMAIHTSQGAFVRVDDLTQLMGRYEKEREDAGEQPQPRSFAAAKLLARNDEDLKAAFPERPITIPEPPSRA